MMSSVNTSAFIYKQKYNIVCFLAWLMWNFINFHIRRMRENAALTISNAAANVTEKKRKTQQEKAQKRKEKKEKEDGDLPEVDRDLRQRK